MSAKKIATERIANGQCLFCGDVIASRRAEHWDFVKYNNESVIVCKHHPGIELCKG